MLMEYWKTHYFPTLAEFVRSGGADLRRYTETLREALQGANQDDILKHHDESVRFLFSYAEPEDRMTIAHRSLLFLTEMLMSCRAPELAAAREMPDKPAVEAGLQAAGRPLGEYAAANKFETVLQHIDSGVALFDEAGNLRFLNVQMSKFLQAPRRSLIGCTIRQLLFHPHLDLSVRRFMLHMLREVKLYHRFHGEFTDAYGRILLVGISQSEELDGDFLVSVKDVSEYKQIEQAAFQNDKLAMLGKIAAAIAHEIRNPLTSIRGFIQLLHPHLQEMGKQEYARIILSEIDRANEIIFEFLNSSKPSAPMMQNVMVSALLKEMILLSESEAHLKDCELHCEIFDADLTVAIDVKQIKQVLLNMIRNAIEAIHEVGDGRKGRIDVSVRREGKFALISVRDNGKGMDRVTLSRLFDPFFSTKEKGTGLGLSVSYRIIKNHGGTIRVESTPNEGTEFMIYLPFTDGKE